MYLYIESVQTDGFRLVIFRPDDIWIENEVKISFSHQESLLNAIDELLTKANCQLNELQRIIVSNGPGSFSALRIGISTANTLAQSLDIPIVSLVYEPDISITKLKSQLIELLNKSGSKFAGPVMANYGREPNITQPK